MEKRKEMSTCSICLEEGDGYHFGAEACKACAAFFRRSVSLNKKYLCRGNNDCDITVNIRCMCRACRFIKCINVGMNPAGVQKRHGTTDSLIKNQFPSDTTPTTSNTTPLSLVPEIPLCFQNQIPILFKMRMNYQKVVNARMVIHKRDGQSLFEERIPKAINYKESVEQGIKEVTIVADFISWCFEDFVNLSIDQKNALFRNFYTPFYMMEGAFLSHINNKPDAVVFPSGDYIDMNHLDKFYDCPEEASPMNKEQIDRLFKPSFNMHKRCLVVPMMADKVDVIEFFALCTLLLWDNGIEDLTEESIEIGRKVKDQVMKEIAFYMRNVKNIGEPVIRVASIVNLLPAVQKCSRRIQDDLEMTQVFNIYTTSKEFYDLVNGNFC